MPGFPEKIKKYKNEFKYCQFFHSLVGLGYMRIYIAVAEQMSISRYFPISFISNKAVADSWQLFTSFASHFV